MKDTDRLVAATRFGLGPTPTTLAALDDPRGWLHGQVDALEAAGVATGPADLDDVGTLAWEQYSATRRDRTQANRMARQVLEAESTARELHARDTLEPFVERLVRFFSNHLTVSVSQQRCMGLVGNFEREVVRAHVGGRFSDMLLASCRHPAMLLYLDQVRSVGPDAPGARGSQGLNENLAREVLELHTLGVDGGYDQSDVEALAAMLTGWTLEPSARRQPPFAYRDDLHQPGAKRLLGIRYAERGRKEAERALVDLAHHPSTARHLATKLAVHFVDDQPPPAAVDALEQAWLDSQGWIPAVARALIELDAAWAVPLSKLKTPADLVTSTARAVGMAGGGRILLASLRSLGQLPFTAPSPAGWPDDSASWAGPDAVLGRVDWAQRTAGRATVSSDGLGPALLGPFYDRELAGVLRGRARTEQIALLLASPAFQRR